MTHAPTNAISWHHRLSPWAVAALTSTAMSVLSTGQMLMLLNARGEASQSWRVLVYGLVQWWLWGVVAVCVWRQVQPLPPARRTIRSLLRTHAPIALGVTLARAVILAALGQFAFDTAGEPRPFWQWVVSYLLGRGAVDVALYAAIGAGALLVAERSRLAGQQRMQEQLTAQLATAELRALRMQLQPHFLFNTLHAIRILVDESPARAQRMIILLGDLLRTVLTADGAQLVPLSQELDFARRYLDIEQLRFEDRLTVTIDVPASLLSIPVPGFLLQPLVENAIRHGVSQSAGSGYVRMSAKMESADLVIDIENSGPLAEAAATHGVGLTTTRERLARLYDGRASCRLTNFSGGVRARVRVPVSEARDVA
jgi:two-component system, LytTR family, sensor kinase